MKQYMETVNYRVTEGSSYSYKPYGQDAYEFSSWNGVHGEGGNSCSIIFDTQTQVVYEVQVHDYTNNRAYRLINPDFSKSCVKDDYFDEAWDDVKYTDLETDDDWLEKAQAIVSGKNYDTRVQVPIELDDKEALTLFKAAHDADMTLNDYVARILQKIIDEQK
jgi:hypothetical protein